MREFLINLFFYCSFFQSYAQEFSISGQIKDLSSNEALFNVSILVFLENDTLQKKGVTSDFDGFFKIQGLKPAEYIVRIQSFGYNRAEFSKEVKDQDLNLGVIKISKDQQLIEIDEVVVKAIRTRVEQKGDTTVYNADAYKVNPDASIEDLVSKMPGISVENGQLKAHGEEVKRVLIDGEEFFGEDARVAIKNLPAEIVNQIQVFDRQSDQAQLTGFKDGEEYKTLNIVTKPGKNTGQFGKLYAGYGTQNRYNAGGNVNLFKGTRKISIIAMSNNVNQQNFSDEDILGVLGSESSSGRGGRNGGGSSNNFLTNQQRGISQTNSIGINYSDKCGKSVKVTGSYFLNHTENNNNTNTSRQYLVGNNANQFYEENQITGNTNLNHRFNARLEYQIDSSNTLIFTPRFSLQKNSSARETNASTRISKNHLLNQLMNKNESENTGFSLASDVLYRHKFAKKGRTISGKITSDFNKRNGTNQQNTMSEFFTLDSDSMTFIDQQNRNLSDDFSISSDISYTEPLSSKMMLKVNYNPTYALSSADRRTNRFDEISENYTQLDTLLSSVFDNRIITQKAGVSLA
jgi:hypothetical protein